MVFEDVNYGGGVGRSYADANSSAVASGFTSGAIRQANATVELYDADGDFVATTTTNSTGQYTFYAVPGSYSVRVVNSTVNSVRTLNSGFTTANTQAVQTFVNGVTNRVGGESPEKQDAAANTGSQTLADLTTGTGSTGFTPQSITNISVPAAGNTGVDFGFNFDLITSTRDAGPGSLRQFIINSNALANTNLAQAGQTAGVETSIFMVPDGVIHAGQRAGLTNQLTNGAAVVTLASTLPNITDAATALNATTQTNNIGDTNAAVATAGSESTGPEVIINFNNQIGLATTAANTRVIGLGFTGVGAGTGSNGAALRVDAGATNSQVLNNTFYNNGANFRINGVSNITVTGNISRNAQNLESDGIEMTASSNDIITNNQFLNNAGFGIDFISGNSNNNTITGNLFAGNGKNTNSGQTAGIGLRDASSNNTISNNTFTANVGDGISAKGGTNNIFSQNSFYDNSDLAIDLTGGANNNGDGVTLNESGDGDTGANGLINFPVITSATIRNGNVLVEGFATPGARIEFYVAAADPSGFGEGQTYFATLTEGSSSDLNASTGSYSGLVNGLNQGTETNQNRFSFSIPLSSLTTAQQNALTASGAKITSTATLLTAVNGNQGTSEFSGNAPVQLAPVANNDYASTTPGTAVTLTVTSNDQNAIDPATVALNGQVAGSTTAVTVTGGTFTFLGNGQVSFVPAAGFTGVATVPYTVNNTSGTTSNTAFISVAVSGTTFNLATSFSVTPAGPVNAGSPVSYTVVSSNPGTVAATSVVETVQLPAGLTTTGFTVGGNSGTLNNGVITFTGSSYNQNTGLLTLNIGNLAANGGSVSTALTFPAPLTSPLVVTANISGAGGVETSTTDNTTVSTVNITPRFDVTTAINGPTTVTAGNEVTYTVVTSNLSSTTSPANANSVSPAVNVVQTVSLSGNLTGAGIYASNGGTVAYNSTQNATVITFPAIGVLAAGQQQVNTISFTAPSTSFPAPIATVTSGLTGTNIGDLNSPTVGTDNNTAQLNGATSRPTITPATRTGTEANVYTSISASAASVAPGANITLTITAGNAGAAAASGVQETVTLPTGLTFSNLNGGTYNANTGVLIFPALTTTLAAGATQTYTVTFAAPQQGFVLATAAVTTSTPDAVPADNLAQTKIEVSPVVDVATTLAGPVVALLGQTVSYTVTTASNGPAAANSVVQTVQLPTGLINVQVNSLSAGSQYNATTGILTISFTEPLAAGFSQTNTVSFTAPAGSANLNVAAAVSTSSAENVLTNNTAAVTTTLTPAADVAISVTAPATATVGNPVPYAVSVTNNGASVATGVAATLQLPAGLGTANVTFPGGTSADSYNNTTGLVTFASVANLANGASATRVVVVTMPDASQISAVGQVATSSYDATLANNYATVATTAATATTATADLRATTSTATAITANAGSAVTITPVFSNLGSATANNVVPQLTLVPGLTGVTVTDGGVTRNADYNTTTGVVTFQSVGSLASGATLSGAYSVTFNAPATGPVTAVASIYSATSDGALTNNTALTTVTVTPQADAQTTIAGPTSAQPGSRVTYEITTSNNITALSPATNVVQTVTIPGTPSNLTFSAGATSAVVNGNTVVTFPTVASMAPGTAGAVTNFISFAAPTTATSLTITANVTSTADINITPASNSASITTIANNAPVAYNVVNNLRSTGEVRFNQVIENTTTTAQLISPLMANDVNVGQTLTYTLTSLPTSGSLYIGNSSTALVVGSPITATEASQLRYLPSPTFVGNVFFTYTATDNATNNGTPTPATSNTALYTIAVGQDVESNYTLTTVKGGATPYQTGDVIANVFDANSGTYNSATPQAVVKDGLSSATLVTTGLPTGYLSSFPAGVGFNTTDANQIGQIVVTNNRLLVAGTYTVRIATVDANGGTSTRDVTFTIGVRPLPVELVSFSAKAAGQDAQLVWRTAQELHNDHFVVERSFDGKSFSAVGQVKGQGTTTLATDYRFTDAQVAVKAAGTVYYRLRQVDTDGTTSFSSVQVVTFAKAEVTISLYPNPATTSAILNLTSLPQGSYKVTIFDAVGRAVSLSLFEGGTTPTLSVQELPVGTYQVLVSGKDFKQALRLIKE
ncbi:right-handed parallel beta-helix repeat-containing protein [Hymenobacter wooponensis]|nr:right-handed parallel beta-helix repeat-containing protein [Hymenobacter wooponensis]